VSNQFYAPATVPLEKERSFDSRLGGLYSLSGEHHEVVKTILPLRAMEPGHEACIPLLYQITHSWNPQKDDDYIVVCI
jgi:hypothetical protein